MKNINTILLIFTISLFAFSCSKDDAQTPTPDATPVVTKYRVKKLTYALNNATITYQYNAQGKMAKETYSDNTNFEYTYNAAGHLISYERAGSFNTIDNFKRVFTRDAAGVILSDIRSENGVNKIKIENSVVNGLITEFNYYNYSAGAWVLVPNYSGINSYNNEKQLVKLTYPQNYSDFFYNEQGNIKEYRNYNRKPDGTYYIKYLARYTFDNRKIHDAQGYLDFVDSMQKNNIFSIQENIYQSNGSGVYQGSSVNFTFDYNPEGYVTKVFNQEDNSLLKTYELEKI